MVAPPLVSPRFTEDPHIVWAPLPYLPLVTIGTDGRTTNAYSTGAAALIASGNFSLQEIPPGAPMLVWLNGAGGAANTSTDIGVLVGLQNGALGTFTLSVGGVTFGPFSSTTTAGQMQTALSGNLPAGASAVVCTGGPLSSLQIEVTYTMTVPTTAQPAITASSANLTRGVVWLTSALQNRPNVVASQIANTASAVAAITVKTGTRGGWDQATPFVGNALPGEQPYFVMHGRDAGVAMRLNIAAAAMPQWAGCVASNAPFVPIILEGTAVGVGLGGNVPTTTTTGGAAGTFFVVHDALLVGNNTWLTAAGLASLHLPLTPLIALDTTSAETFQRSAWKSVSRLTPGAGVGARPAAILLRSTVAKSRERYVLDTAMIHPFFRRDRGT